MAEKKKMGRPTILDDRLKHIMVKLAEKGYTLQQIADTVRINRATLHRWLGADSDFCDTLKSAKNLSNELVEVSLLNRALGYSHTAVKMFYDKDRGKVIKEKYIEHYPPSEVAAIFWLKNRDPERWRDKQEIDLAAKEIKIEISKDDKDL